MTINATTFLLNCYPESVLLDYSRLSLRGKLNLCTKSEKEFRKARKREELRVILSIEETGPN
jgi:hypothetical protein